MNVQSISITYEVENLDNGVTCVAASSADLPGYTAFGHSIDECRGLVDEYLRLEHPGAVVGHEVVVPA
jgi:hypothetical protein